jgi:hypothetical protein
VDSESSVNKGKIVPGMSGGNYPVFAVFHQENSFFCDQDQNGGKVTEG